MRGRTFAFLGTLVQISMLVGMIVSGPFTDRYGPRWTWAACSMILALAALNAVRVGRSANGASKSFPSRRARAETQLRALRRRSATRFARRADLLVRVHLVCGLRRERPRERLSELWRRVRPAADPAGPRVAAGDRGWGTTRAEPNGRHTSYSRDELAAFTAHLRDVPPEAR